MVPYLVPAKRSGVHILVCTSLLIRTYRIGRKIMSLHLVHNPFEWNTFRAVLPSVGRPYTCFFVFTSLVRMHDCAHSVLSRVKWISNLSSGDFLVSHFCRSLISTQPEMSVEENLQSQNGHHKPRSEARSEVLELDAKRKRIESEIKEYQEILRSVCDFICVYYLSIIITNILSASLSKGLVWRIRWLTAKGFLETISI